VGGPRLRKHVVAECQASSELPDKVDTDNAQHAGMLSKYGIDPSRLSGKLGGLGKAL
jgi:hypothetical protein